MKFGDTNYWREAQRPALFLVFDARIVLFIGLALLHFRVWTLVLLAVSAVVFWRLETRGINPGNLPILLRAWINGPRIPARSRRLQREPVDYLFEACDPGALPPKRKIRNPLKIFLRLS
ncbi:MAG: IcmT/TraK family protein [Albidovulum sp.]|nr:IcmT/TraK family protein [Albidovulum sp.]